MASNQTTAGKGVNIEVKGDEVVIKFSLKNDFGASASGKTKIVATTSGNVNIPGTDVTLGLNAYRKA